MSSPRGAWKGSALFLGLILAISPSCGGGGGGSGTAGPSGLSYTLPASPLQVGFAITALTPTFSGNVNSFDVSAGELPAGLRLDAGTGVISGRPLKPYSGPVMATIEATFGSLTTTFDVTFDVELPAASRFALAPAENDDTLLVYAVDSTSGMLRHHDYAFTGSGPVSASTTPEGGFVYTANRGSNDVSGFAFDGQSGTLTELVGSPYPIGVDPIAIVVDPTGRYVYAAVENGGVAGEVYQFTLDTVTGELTAFGTPSVIAGDALADLAADPLGHFLFVARGLASGSVQVLRIGVTGELVAGTSATTGDTPAGIGVHPCGEFLYVANNGSNDLSAFAIDGATGDLTELATSPIALGVGAGPSRLELSPDGAFLYASCDDGTVAQFAVDLDGTATGTEGSLTALAPASTTAGTSPAHVTCDSTGRFVYVSNNGSDDVSSFVVELDGTLTRMAVPETTGHDGPAGLCFVPGGEAVAFGTTHLFASNFNDDDINRFEVEVDGTLSSLVPTVEGTGSEPNWTEVHPHLDTLYSVNSGEANNALEVFSIGPDGSLTSRQEIAQANVSTWSFHVELSGRFGYSINSSLNQVIPYDIDANGDLTARTPIGVSLVPAAGALHPSGRFFYVPNSVADSVSQFSIDLPTGTLSPLAPTTVSTSDAPIALAVHPSGKFLYSANNGSGDNVTAFRIATDGRLSELTASPVAAGTDPFDVVVHPDGGLLLVGNRASWDVSVFAINTDIDDATEDGSLTLLDTVDLSGPPHKLRFDHGGLVLYVSVALAAGRVETFTVDAMGVLTPLDIDFTGNESRGLDVLRNFDPANAVRNTPGPGIGALPFPNGGGDTGDTFPFDDTPHKGGIPFGRP